MKLRQIVHTWLYGETSILNIVKSLQKIGADGADLMVSLNESMSNPDMLLRQDIRRIMNDYGKTVLCVSPQYRLPELDLSHVDEHYRRIALDFSKRAIDVTAHAGCDYMLVSPSYISAHHRVHRSYAKDWEQALMSMRELAEYAAKCSITLLIEPINRYVVSLVHTVDEGLKMIREVGMSNVGLVPDTFHMNIEESADIANTLYAVKDHMRCLHVGDNNRKVPGRGSMDWKGILEALMLGGFSGPLSHEPAFLYFDKYRSAKDVEYMQAFEQQLTYGIKYLRMVMESVAQGEKTRPI